MTVFLDVVLQRNPALVDIAREWHSAGMIGPDTYLIDRDALDRNAACVAATAAAHRIEPWFIVKQLGRNPAAIETIAKHMPHGAAIDVREAQRIVDVGARLGNIGHLVQVPRRALPRILRTGPKFVTVFDEANLRAVNDTVRDLGLERQDVLLRIAAAPGDLYPGQEGGFEPETVLDVMHRAESLQHVRIAGVTAFPCVLYDGRDGVPITTSTFERALRARDGMSLRLQEDVVFCAPSHSSCSTIPMLAAEGVTHVEPGHALTGTTPEHARNCELPELPAYVYVSEVAQVVPRPMVIGGGFYPRGHATHVLLQDGTRATLAAHPADNIDYYRGLDMDSGRPVTLGETAVMSFRTQMFVTRSLVAVVSGLSAGQPRLDGIWTGLGSPERVESV